MKLANDFLDLFEQSVLSLNSHNTMLPFTKNRHRILGNESPLAKSICYSHCLRASTDGIAEHCHWTERSVPSNVFRCLSDPVPQTRPAAERSLTHCGCPDCWSSLRTTQNFKGIRQERIKSTSFFAGIPQPFTHPKIVWAPFFETKDCLKATEYLTNTYLEDTRLSNLWLCSLFFPEIWAEKNKEKVRRWAGALLYKCIP